MTLRTCHNYHLPHGATYFKHYDICHHNFFSAYYLYQWKDYSGSRSADGEIPLSELENVIFCECNPTAELLNAIKSIKSDGKYKR